MAEKITDPEGRWAAEKGIMLPEPEDEFAPRPTYVLADPEGGAVTLYETDHIWPELDEQLEELRYHFGPQACRAVTDGGGYYGLLYLGARGSGALLFDNMGGPWAVVPLKRGPAGDLKWYRLFRWELGTEYRQAFADAAVVLTLN